MAVRVTPPAPLSRIRLACDRAAGIQDTLDAGGMNSAQNLKRTSTFTWRGVW